MHMTGCRYLINNFISQREGSVSFGNNAKGYVLGYGNVSSGKMQFDKVNLVENLEYNLLSVSQMCDKGYSSFFTKTACKIISPEGQKLIEKIIEDHTLLIAKRCGNVYAVDIEKDKVLNKTACFFSKASTSENDLWHRRLGHVNFKTINKVTKMGLVRGLPLKEYQCKEHCVSCLKGKQHKSSYKSIEESKTTACLQLLHMDLFGPVKIMSLGKKKYCLVIIDDYSRFTWVFFLYSKDEAAEIIKFFILQVEKQYSLSVKVIRSDNGTEFRNKTLDEFCLSKGIVRQFSIPRTPEQNGVVERKNRTLIEAARTMLADSGLPLYFWAEAVNTACYVQNRVLINKRHTKTAYEILHGIKPLISFFRAFGCQCFILNIKDSISKFAAKVDTGYFLGYSPLRKAYKVFNSRTKIVEETLNVKFNESKHTLIPADPAELFDLDSFHFGPEKTVESSKPPQNGFQGFEDDSPAPWTPNTVRRSTIKPSEVSIASTSETTDEHLKLLIQLNLKLLKFK